MDRLAQASIEQEVGARLTERYWRWISWPLIRSEIQLWSQAYRYRYGSDTDGLKQITDMYHAVAAELEKIKAKQIGYDVDDVHFYSIEHLKELVAQVCAGVHSTRLDPAYADVERGIWQLVPAHVASTLIGYHHQQDVDEGTYTLALAKLQEVLGGQRPKGLK